MFSKKRYCKGTVMDQKRLTHLRQLEAESIHIIR
ncbi:sulfate adenylyltransferase small subunit, partial [Salmonella enterica]